MDANLALVLIAVVNAVSAVIVAYFTSRRVVRAAIAYHMLTCNAELILADVLKEVARAASEK